MDRAIKAAKDPATDKVIDAVMQVEPTKEGRWKVRAVVLLYQLRTTAKEHHAHHGSYSCTPFCDCEYDLCRKNLTLIKNTEKMLTQGV